MSIAEVERFSRDLAANPGLQATLKPDAAGPASVVAAAKQHGYDFTVDEAKQYVRSHAERTLTDEELEAVAGGSKAGATTKAVKITVDVVKFAAMLLD